MMKLILLSFLACVTSQQLIPGAQIFVGQKGFDFITATAETLIGTELTKLTLPTLDTTELTMNIQLNDLKLNQFSLGNLAIEVVNGEGLDIVIDDLSFALTGAYSFREKIWPHIPNGHGTMEVDLSKSSARLSVQVGVTPQGHPQIQALNDGFCNAKINLSTIKLNGGLLTKIADKLLFNSVMDKFFSSIISKHFCSAFSSIVTKNLNPALVAYSLSKTLPLKAPFNNAVIDFALSGFVEYDNLVKVGVVGEVVDAKDPSKACPFTPLAPNTTDFNLDSHMFAFILTPFPIETAFYTFYTQNVLHATIDKNNLPSSVPFKLNTDTFKLLIPQLYKAYPNLDLQITAKAGSALELKMTPTGITAAAKLALQWDAVNGTDVLPGFVIECPASATVEVATKIDLSRGTVYVTGKVDSINCVAEVQTSSIGDISKTSITLLNNLLSAALKIGVLPGINSKLQAGFPLPSVDGIWLRNAELIQGDGFLAVKTDIFYEPKETIDPYVIA